MPDESGRSRIFVSRRTRRSALAWLALLCVAVAAGALASERFLPALTEPAALRAFVGQFGVWAPVAFVAVQALQVVVAPIPGQVTGFVAGYLFGPVTGTVYSVVGVTLGSALAFWLSRRFGRPYVERVVTPETLARFDALADRNATAGLFLAFLVPGLPDDALCFVGGLTDLPLRRLVLIALVGRAPSFALMALAGARFASRRLVDAALLVLALAVLAAVGYRSRDRLLAWVSRR
ncbi:MAG: TVP38/TMEM64 family protein [Haloarculaceae archaeon]